VATQVFADEELEGLPVVNAEQATFSAVSAGHGVVSDYGSPTFDDPLLGV
jgi:hypothetical protein